MTDRRAHNSTLRPVSAKRQVQKRRHNSTFAAKKAAPPKHKPKGTDTLERLLGEKTPLFSQEHIYLCLLTTPCRLNHIPHNKPRSRQGSPFAAGRKHLSGRACDGMNWHEHFTYDAVSGNLIWKSRKLDLFQSVRSWKMWNTRYADTIAGRKAYRLSDGKPMAINLRFMGKGYMVHRIIWEMHYGPIPHGMLIDHINGNPFDNRITNLRLATSSNNNCNRAAKNGCTSKFKGVYWNKKDSRWMARIKTNKKCLYLGSFILEEEAYAAYCAASKIYHGEFGRNENPTP